MDTFELIFIVLVSGLISLIVAPMIFITYVYITQQGRLTDEEFDKKWAELKEKSKKGKPL